MATILDHKTEGVTLGVTDKNLRLEPELQSVTFADVLGAIHTVFAHVDGPFKTAEDVIEAHARGVLHTFKSHDDAAAFARTRGDTTFIERLEEAFGQHTDQQQQTGGNY